MKTQQSLRTANHTRPSPAKSTGCNLHHLQSSPYRRPLLLLDRTARKPPILADRHTPSSLDRSVFPRLRHSDTAEPLLPGQHAIRTRPDRRCQPSPMPAATAATIPLINDARPAARYRAARPVPVMESSVHPTITNGHLPPPSRHDTDALPNDAVAAYRLDPSRSPLPDKVHAGPDSTDPDSTAHSRTLGRDPNQQRSRPDEEERHRSLDSVTNMASMLISRTVAPFLKEHIPGNYAPIGKPNNEHTARDRNPNTKTCYRHRPDSKCRRAADEAKMDMIQKELDMLPSKVCCVGRSCLRTGANLFFRTSRPSPTCGRSSPPLHPATGS